MDSKTMKGLKSSAVLCWRQRDVNADAESGL